jgi:formylglycine-generating enzyme required for sulfatase activity
MEEMERRLAFASTVMERTVREFYGVWQQIGAEVTPDRGFPEGMTLKPQVGLVPLGPDPESGYLEFALLASGVPPRRDSASGRLQIGEDSAIVLVLLPGGSVTIGCRDGDPGRRANEVLREELLKPFFLGKHEVTQAQWLRAMGKNQASGSPGGVRGALLTLQHPVENVSWDQCAEFCRRLDVALPSEAQWEYAGRAGTDSVFAYGNDPSCLEGRENLGDRSLQSLVIDDLTTEPVPWDDGFPMHAPVGSFPANRFGLHDMLGNVSEWCLDPYSATDSVTTAYEGAATDALAETDKRVWRGGNWQFGPVQARCARRDSHAHWSVIPTRGLRVARALRH